MNYAQVTALFRVEERPVGFAIASVANVLITIGSTIVLVVGFHKGALGAVIGNFLGTLTVYFALLAYRRYQLGFQFDRKLLRAMNRFGLPLVPSALALWVINLIDRLFINRYKGQAEVGIYSLAVSIASVIVFLLTAFQLAWPAFAYSIRDDNAAKRTYSYVLTYLLFITCWMSLAIGSMAPWIVHLVNHNGTFARSAEAVPILCFATAAYSGYSVLAIGIGRMRKTQLNWVVSGTAALVNIVINIALIPVYGMMGAAVSTLDRLPRPLRRHVVPEPPGLSGPLPVAAHLHALRGRRRSHRNRVGDPLAPGRDRAHRDLPARAAGAPLLPAGGAHPAPPPRTGLEDEAGVVRRRGDLHRVQEAPRGVEHAERAVRKRRREHEPARPRLHVVGADRDPGLATDRPVRERLDPKRAGDAARDVGDTSSRRSRAAARVGVKRPQGPGRRPKVAISPRFRPSSRRAGRRGRSRRHARGTAAKR